MTQIEHLIESKVNVLHWLATDEEASTLSAEFPQQQGSYLIGKYFVAFETMFI